MSETIRANDGAHIVGLDALRACAALMVFVTHMAPSIGIRSPLLAGGQPGVALFYVLSGYLLWRPFVTGTATLRRYVASRAARILPAYWLACLVLVPIFGGELWRYLTFTQAELYTMGVSGTLQTEVMFYLALPLLALVRRPLAVPVVLGVASLALEVWLNAVVQDRWLLERTLPFRLWQFAPGMVLAVVMPMAGRRWVVYGAAILFVGMLLGPYFPDQGTYTNVVVVAGAGLLVGWGISARPRYARLWAAGAAISYALYLWHADLLRLVGPVAIPLSFVVAGLSYVLLERPFIRLGKRLGCVPALAPQRFQTSEIFDVARGDHVRRPGRDGVLPDPRPSK